MQVSLLLDLGAVGKGYTGDLVVELLKENGITSALLDLGGNIQTIGTKPDGTQWRLGLRSPFDEGSFATLGVTDCAVITSGGYERYFVGEDGETYWHILDEEWFLYTLSAALHSNDFAAVVLHYSE